MFSRTLPIQIADHIREMILSGDLAPGQRIVEADLATTLDISRNTLRVALQRLTFEGLLVQNQFKSTHVILPTADDVYETYTLRNTLEAMSCRLAAQRSATADTTEMNEAVERMETAAASGDIATMKKADFDFHSAVVDLAGHSRLRTHYRMLHVQTRLYLNLTVNRVDYQAKEVAEIHAAMASAIREGDVETAERLGSEHSTKDGEALCRILADGHSLPEKSGQAALN